MSKASVLIGFGTGAIFGVLTTLVCQRVTWKLVQAEYFYFVCIVLWGIAMIFLACSISSWNERRWFKQTRTYVHTTKQARSHRWWLLPLLLAALLAKCGLDSKVIATTPAAKSSAPAVMTVVKPVVGSAVTTTAKSVVVDAEASRRQRMWGQLQTIAAKGARNGEGCIAFTKRLALTEAGKYLDLEPLNLNECVALAMANRVPALHYRHSDGSATIMAPELARGTGSGWHIGVDTTINGVPVFVVTRQWSIKGMP